MLSIAEYVKQRGVSQTAVRRQLARYAEELEGHTPKINRKTMLDDVAIQILDSHRMPREVIIQQASEDVQKEINDLRAQIDLMKDKTIELQNVIIDLQAQNTALIENKGKSDMLLGMMEEYKDKSDMLLELMEKDKGEMQELREKNDILSGQVSELENHLQTAKAEADSYERSWFGLYRKKKQ